MQQYQLISRWLQGQVPGKILPWQIDLDTTNICNQACYYCNTEQFREDKPVYQSLDKYLELVDKLSGWRKYDPNVVGTTNNIIFSGGGEPTLLPGYNQIIETAIDNGFVTAMNTNGTKLHKLLDMGADKLKRMAYIGLDIDSGDPETYETIRRSKLTNSPFNKVKETATILGEMGAPIDVKALLMPENTSDYEIDRLFEFAKSISARGVHLRPVVIDNVSFQITDRIKQKITEASAKYKVHYNLAVGRYEPRSYSKCHQMFLFPSFCADGNVYLCCEYKGREDTKLGSWVDEADWRDLWCSDHHKRVYNKFRTAFCKPCRPNTTNNKIEFALKNSSSVLDSFI
jgi:MoaA/NifB/PqqE/SkfB family radical SAM enzyme